MTVQEFMVRNRQASFDMMTPGGYVYLTPEKAQELLSGKSVAGNPGCKGFDVEITADELLNQEVCSANFSDGVWRMLTNCVQEQEYELAPMEPGVKMC